MSRLLTPIHKLSAQMGLTSRTLRHWESEGLFTSTRDAVSNWRVYDENAVLSVRITVMLRQFDIPIKGIKTVLDNKTYDSLLTVIKRHISVLKAHSEEHANKSKQLTAFMAAIEEQQSKAVADECLANLPALIGAAGNYEIRKDEITMSNTIADNTLQFVTLPPMRVAYNVAVGVSPEDDAMNPVLDWLKSESLLSTAKLLGGNMPPMPSEEGKPYGYGTSATIPENVSVPAHLKEARFPGGIYARLESTDDIPGSWNKLMKLISEEDKYTSDRSRKCFEEHISNDKGGFILVLLEPVKEKKHRQMDLLLPIKDKEKHDKKENFVCEKFEYLRLGKTRFIGATTAMEVL